MHCRKLFAVAALVAACDPQIKQVTTAPVVTARFDPAQTPPVVPTPNDLATDPKTGLLAIPVPPGASEADQQFIAYLNTLDGYPTSVTANETFSGTLTASSVNANDVRVYDVTANLMKVVAGTPLYGDAMDGGSGITLGAPAGGWTAGHTYAIAMLSGANGLKDSSGANVFASPTWALLRSSGSLVTCADLTSPDCGPATALIPSAIKDDPAARFADQTATAIQLEMLRLKYQPIVDRVVMDGFQRSDLVILWTFRIASFPQVAFEPPTTVPLPNDLGIDPVTHKVVVPDNPSFSAAYKELIRDYLNTLNGFPVSSTATVGIVGGDLDPASVTPQNVIVSSLNGMTLSGQPDVSYDAATKMLSIAPPDGSWGKGNEVAIAVLGGAAGEGVTQPGGAPVVASPTWALVRGTASLVTCAVDCANPAAPGIPAGCGVAITSAPLTLDQAGGLECLRELYAPVLDGRGAHGRPRERVDILWTFRTMTFPEATFDPLHSVIPFPNDLLRATMPPHLTLPVPDGGSMLQQQLVLGLNTLDGFSLTAPIVSESSPTLGPIDTGLLDPATLDGGTGFLKLSLVQGTTDVAVCLNCASSPLPDGGAQTAPQQLQFVPRVPLTEQQTYGAFMTDALKDTDGNPVIASPTFAILRLRNPVCDTASNKSLLPIVSDAQACAPGGLEDARLKLKPMLDNFIDPLGVTRKQLALAWAFTTQTTVTELSNLHDAVPTAAVLANAGVQAFPVPTAMVAPPGLPVSALAANVYLGTLELPFALTGPGGTMRTPNAWLAQKATFLLTVPAGMAPAGGWPVVLFGHPLDGNHLQAIAIANTFAAAGQATVAIDAVWHGDRSTCAGSAVVLQASIPNATDDYACADPTNPLMPNPATTKCDEMTGRCVARTGTPMSCMVDAQCIAAHQGFCTAGGTCEGADFVRTASGAPAISAWNFLNLSNLFATRDNFRHYPLDLAQVVKVLKDTTMTGLSAKVQGVGGPALDGTRLNYAGMSLGGFEGALFGAVDKSVTNVALNVPGSDQTTVLLLSPAFADQRTAFLGQLAANGIEQGTPDFDSFVVFAKTIFDRADPQNFGLTAVNLAAAANRKVLIEWIEDDFVVPNVTTDELIVGASSGAGMPVLDKFTLTAVPFTTLMPADRHGFLLNFKDPTTTITAQTRVAHFILTGSPQ